MKKTTMPKAVWNIVQGVLRSEVKRGHIRTKRGLARAIKRAFRIGVAQAQKLGYVKKGTWKSLTPKGRGKEASIRKLKMTWEGLKKGGLRYVRRIIKKYGA